MSIFLFLLSPFLVTTSIAADERQALHNTSATDTDEGDLEIMVSNLTNIMEEQNRMMIEFHSVVLKKLEEQTEMLALLLKKGKGSNLVSKASIITTLAPSKVVSLPASLPSNSNWSYTNLSTWLSDYPMCGQEYQSPIDLHTVDVSLKDHKNPISFASYDLLNKDTCVMVNNGNTATLQMKTNDDSSHPILSGGPFNSTEYFFTHAVLHLGADNTLGSEHTIRGITYPMEMQLMHQSSSGEENKLAITSFLFEVSEEENPVLASLVNTISKIKTVGTNAHLNSPPESMDENHTADERSQEALDVFSMDLLIKESISGPYFTYQGSLTYPPCTEVKQYVVFRVPLDISSKQLEQFRLVLQQDGTRMVNNIRPVNTLGDRVLDVPIHSACGGVPLTTWNTDQHTIGPAIQSWLHSIVSVGERVDRVESMLYHPVTGEYSKHYAHYNDVLEESNNLVDTDRRVVTIGTYNTGFPSGLAWQWRGKRRAEGFLYGEVDRRGQFSGDNITFIYPDFVTGLRGRYEYGVLVWATAVKIVGERCREGIKEIMMETADSDGNVIWEKEEATQWYIGRHPQVMDPHERKSVYVGNSLIPGSDEGLFARRSFMPGDIVSYFSGTRTFTRDMFFDNMTEAEISSAGAYFYNLGANSPDWWGYPEELVLDIPEEYRSIYKFRTTLGHKANHLFEGKNTEFDTVNHPVHGGIACLIATKVINKDDEIYVDYLYDVDDEATEQWYKDLYDKTYG